MVQGGVLIGADPDPSYVKLQREVKDSLRISRAALWTPIYTLGGNCSRWWQRGVAAGAAI